MLYTTLNKIRACNPCSDGWSRLLHNLGKTSADDEPLSFIAILESNGFDDALWCARSAPEFDRVWRLLAVTYARDVQHLMTDQRSIAALDVAERHANGQATDKELDAARAAAEASARTAARDAAGDAAWASAWVSARSAARSAAGSAAWSTAGSAAWSKQEAQFREVVK